MVRFLQKKHCLQWPEMQGSGWWMIMICLDWDADTLLGTNISPTNGTFKDYFPFPKVGYVIVPWRVNIYIFSHATSQVSLFSDTLEFDHYFNVHSLTKENLRYANCDSFCFFQQPLQPQPWPQPQPQPLAFFFHSPLFVVLVFWVLGRTGDARSDDFSGSPRNVRSFKAFLSRGPSSLARFLSFLVLVFGVGWCLEMGKKKPRGPGLKGFGLFDVFFVGMRFLGVASKKKMDAPKKSADVPLRFVWGRFWRMIPGRCCQTGWHLNQNVSRSTPRNIPFAGFGVNWKSLEGPELGILIQSLDLEKVARIDMIDTVDGSEIRQK